MDMDLDRKVEPGTHESVVHVRGDVDIESAPVLRARLEQLHGRVVLDLREVGFLDSSGLNLFVRQHKRLARDGGSLTLRNPQGLVLRVLQFTGLDAYLEVDA